VAAIETFGEPDHRRERLHSTPDAARQVAVALVRLLRGGLPVIPRDERDRLDLERIESPQIPVLDQVVRMSVMTLVADVDADVV
jgi:hypothetical protein